MDRRAETELARLNQFRQDRWIHALGHVGATAALVAVAWSSADHTRLLWFAVAHHLATWVMALSFFLPLRSEAVKRIPRSTLAGAAVGNATLSSALFFDLDAATELTFTLAVGIVLFAGAAGSFLTLGVHSTLMRIALTSLLVPFVVGVFIGGHTAVGFGVLFFYLNVVIAGVWQLSRGQHELIRLRIEAANRAATAQLAAETDQLTGLLNRRGLKRYDGMKLTSGAAALYLDINDFKMVNDTHGHDVGDEVLHVVAQRLRNTFSASDPVARLGGDEFLVVLLDPAQNVVDAAVNRITDELQHPVKLASGSTLAISAAIGKTQTTSRVLSMAEVLRNGDLSMYQAKRRRKAQQQQVVSLSDREKLAESSLTTAQSSRGN